MRHKTQRKNRAQKSDEMGWYAKVNTI